jgi:hypothetical protein
MMNSNSNKNEYESIEFEEEPYNKTNKFSIHL